MSLESKAAPNPSSYRPQPDIAGANGAGWFSILVRTGVYEPEDGPPAHVPTHEAADAEEAVRWAIAREVEGVKQRQA